jgi:hypothetical protein
MISLRTIVLGTLSRFLPALLVGTAVLFTVASMLDRVTVGWVGLAASYAWLTLGYTGALIALRYRLRADADVTGRRSVVAGLLAPAAYVSGMVLLGPQTTVGFTLASVMVGMVLALGMFFPWLKGAPVASLTDREAQQLLEEGPPHLSGVGQAGRASAPREPASR